MSRLKDQLPSRILQRDPVLGPVWMRKRLKYSDFSAAATTLSVTAFTLPARCLIHGVFIKHSEAFAGPSVTAATVKVGITGTLGDTIGASDVFTAVGATVFYTATAFKMYDATVATNILATLVTTGANTSVLTAGQLEIGLLVSEIP